MKIFHETKLIGLPIYDKFSVRLSIGPPNQICIQISFLTISSSHTLLLHDAIAAFPGAKIVGPEAAEAKLVYAKACQGGRWQFKAVKTTHVPLSNKVEHKG